MCDFVSCLQCKYFLRLNVSLTDKPKKQPALLKSSIVAQLYSGKQDTKSLSSMICVKPV